MAFTCGFFNSVAHDRKYDAVQHGMIFDGIITDGIYATYLKAMVVKASENASEVIVQPGRAWFNHTWSYNDSDYPVAAPEPEVVLDRIDTLVLDVNSEDAVRNNQFLWVQGTPTSQTPEPPELIHTATHNQYPLCDVYRQAGTTMIYAADITNRVGTSDCPFVTGVLESIDIDDLLAQWDDEFHTWENATKASFEGWMLNQQQVYTAWFNALKTQMAGDVEDVEAWVQTIKDIIDEETATHLQLEIDEINSMLPSGSHITVTTSDTELYSRTVTITDEDGNTVTSQFDANGVAVFKSVPYVGNLTITSTDGVRTATEVVNTPYFARYEFTLAFWSATVNIIGDSVFGGDTVTITDSTTALVGTVVLNASGTGVFNATYPDTYKFSVTHGGETMEVSLAVTQETTYNVEIHSGLNYQAWLNAGRVSKSFSSLDDVLEDEKTLRQLFLVHDAVDYVASQRVNNDLTKIFNTDLAAKWINNSDYALDKFYAVADIKTVMDTADKYGYGEWCLMPQVPKMTSNTAPYGEVIYSSQNSNYPAYRAFNMDTGTSWGPNDANVPTYIGYHFIESVCINGVDIRPDANSSGRSVKDFKVQASNDGFVSDIHDLLIDEVPYGTTEETFHYEFDNSDKYSYYRVYITSKNNWSGGTSISIVQFYAYAPKGNVPVMTANTAPFGEAITNTPIYSSRQPYLAFDKATKNTDLSNSWTASTLPADIGYKATTPFVLRKVWWYTVYNASYPNKPKKYKIQGSNTGNTNDWHDLTETITTSTDHGEEIVDITDNDTPYLYHRMYITETWRTGEQYVAVSALQFYGRSLSVSVPTMTSNTAPFGVASANSVASDYAAWKAFDKSESTVWNAAGITTNGLLTYKFPSPVCIKSAYVSDGSENRLRTYKIQASNDGTNFTDITGVITYNNSSRYIDIDNDGLYLYYRLNVLTAVTNITIHEVQYYGLDYSEKEFEVGTTKKWLYDHGVELETISVSSASQVTKNANSITLVGNNQMVTCGCSVNLTAYSIARAKIPYFNGSDCHHTIASSLSASAEAYTNVTSSNTPYNMVVDVSAINAARYVRPQVARTATLEVTELWLE